MIDHDVPPTGWYPDPLSTARLRWWDGTSWTLNTVSSTQPDLADTAKTAEDSYRANPAASNDTMRPPFDRSVGSRTPATSSCWASVAQVLYAAQTAPVPIPVEIKLPGMPSITVDPRTHAFAWDLDLAMLPESTKDAGVALEILRPDEEWPPMRNGQDLDVLMWRICQLAFPETLAPWLGENDAIRLRRWPNVTEMGLDREQMLMLSTLAVSALSARTLTTLAGNQPQLGYGVVNALALMGALEVERNEHGTRELGGATVIEESAELASVLARLRAEGSERNHVIACAGPMGSGKTTAVRSLSDIDVVSTEATNFDRTTADKATTTVGIDYGELRLGEHAVARLYGLPGQRRFSFIWSMMEERADSLLLLVNADSEDPAAQVREYLHAFISLATRGGVAVGITRGDLRESSIVAEVRQAAKAILPDRLVPVFTVDARDRGQMMQMLAAVIADVELRSVTAKGVLA